MEAKKWSSKKMVKAMSNESAHSAIDKWDNEEDKHWNKEELPTAAYAIVDKRNGDVWNISTEDRLLEAEAQQMGENHVLEDMLLRRDVVNLVDSLHDEVDDDRTVDCLNKILDIINKKNSDEVRDV